MQVLVTTDNHIEGNDRLVRFVESDVHSSMDRFGSQLTRVEVHLKDLNSDKKTIGDDKRCVVEARLGGLQPISARHDAPTVDQALHGALGALERAIDRTLDKVGSKKGRVPFGGEAEL